jgi:hypothetical protein
MLRRKLFHGHDLREASRGSIGESNEFLITVMKIKLEGKVKYGRYGRSDTGYYFINLFHNRILFNISSWPK